MKRLLLLLLSGAIITCSSGKDQIDIQVREKSFSIRGNTVAFPLRRDNLIAILGPFSRSEIKMNTLLTWDSYGLVAYEQPQSREIIQISANIRPQALSFSPHKLYTGNFSLGSCSVSKSTTISDLGSCMPGHPFIITGPGMPLWFSPYAQFKISVNSDSEEEKSALIESISILP